MVRHPGRTEYWVEEEAEMIVLVGEHTGRLSALMVQLDSRSVSQSRPHVTSVEVVSTVLVLMFAVPVMEAVVPVEQMEVAFG